MNAELNLAAEETDTNSEPGCLVQEYLDELLECVTDDGTDDDSEADST
jgi:hypothetical protein